MSENIAATLRQIPNNTLHPNNIAIRIPSSSSNEELTYKELHDLIHTTGTSLCEKIELEHGHVVSIAMPNTVPFIVSFLAVTWASAVSAPLNPNYTESEYKFYMEDAESVLLLVNEEGNAPAEAAAATLHIPVYSIAWSTSNKLDIRIDHKSGPKTIQFDENKMPSMSADPILQPSPSDVALFLHTSGTTAKPKGVPLTHANLSRSITNITNTYQLDENDATLLVMPLFHVHGLMSALLSTLSTGGCVILPPEGKFTASQFWSHAKCGNATWVTCVPTIYQVLLLRYEQDYPTNDPPQFRFVRSCSSSLAPSIFQQIEDKFHAPCLEAYAMTEASHQMCSNPLEGERKPGTVGMGTGVQIAILDKSNVVLQEPNTEGEVCVRGENVMAGYKGASSEVNEAAFAGGWFHTGDQGKLDDDGYLTLTGRIKELINRGGEKISPLEVDAAMLRHPNIAEAVSFAMPHSKYGEDVAAAVVLKDKDVTLGVKEMTEFLSEKLSSFKIPKELFVADELPKTAMGKIQRRIVAKHFLED